MRKSNNPTTTTTTTTITDSIVLLVKEKENCRFGSFPFTVLFCVSKY